VLTCEGAAVAHFDVDGPRFGAEVRIARCVIGHERAYLELLTVVIRIEAPLALRLDAYGRRRAERVLDGPTFAGLAAALTAMRVYSVTEHHLSLKRGVPSR
jgi:hypothetical protein